MGCVDVCLFPLLYNESAHLQSLYLCSVSLSIYINSWWGPCIIWIHGCFSASWFAPFSSRTGAKMNRHAKRNLGMCKSFANLHFRHVWQDINSVPRKGDWQEKPLKSLIFRKMVMLCLLMADKCCLHVTWTECRWAICASRLQDWKQQHS